MNNDNSIKNFSHVGIGRIITIAFQALFYLVIAALLDPEIYGELNVILALAGTFSIVSSFGLGISTQVYRAKKNYEITNQITTLFIILTTIAALILLIINPIAAFLCITISFFGMTQSHLLGSKQYKKYMIYSTIKSGTFFVIPILLYFVFDINGIIFGMAISNLLGSVPFFKYFSFRSFAGLKNYYKVLIHNFGVYAGATLPFTVDKLLIAPFFGFFIVGIYSFNLQVFLALSVLPGILGAYLITEESSGVGHRKLSKLVVIGSIILAAITIILAPILVPVFFPKYVEGILALQVLVITIIPQSIYVIYRAKLLGNESTKIGFSAIVRIGSFLPLIVILGEIFGLVGLSFAVLISTLASTAFMFLLYKKEK